MYVRAVAEKAMATLINQFLEMKSGEVTGLSDIVVSGLLSSCVVGWRCDHQNVA